MESHLEPHGAHRPDAASLLEHLNAHRSIRRFRPDPIDDDLLETLLETGLRASSSGNMQTWSVVVTRDPELRDALVEPHMGQTMVREAPALLTFCADVHRMRRWLALRDAPDANADFMAFMVAAVDAVLASQNVALAAEAHGLGICYLGSTLANCDRIGRTLGLPWGVVPVVGFVMGRPAERPARRDRLPLEGLVHHERYAPPSDDEVLETYRDREVAGWQRYMANPRLKARVEESGVDNLAQLYSVLKYPKDEYAVFSRNVLEYLDEQGFSLSPPATVPAAAGTVVRRARPDEAEALSALAFRSKASWGYDEAFMESCREELTYTPRFVQDHPVFVLVDGEGVAGFYALATAPEGSTELDALFVAPERLRRGHGRTLIEHAVDTARGLGARGLLVQADPHAEPFYRGIGARRIGERESRSVPGRVLALYRLDLGD